MLQFHFSNYNNKKICPSCLIQFNIEILIEERYRFRATCYDGHNISNIFDVELTRYQNLLFYCEKRRAKIFSFLNHGRLLLLLTNYLQLLLLLIVVIQFSNLIRVGNKISVILLRKSFNASLTFRVHINFLLIFIYHTCFWI